MIRVRQQLKHLLRYRRVAYTLGEASNALNLLLVVLVARPLGVERFGTFISIIAVSTILGTLVNFGYIHLLTRTVARRREGVWEDTLYALKRQTVLSIPMLAVLFLFMAWADFSSSARIAGFLIGASFGIRALKATLRGLCRGLERFGLEALFLWTERLALLLIGVPVVLLDGGLLGLGVVFFAVRGVDLAAYYLFVSRLLADENARSGERSIDVRAAAPFAASTFLWNMYYQVDVGMLKALSTPRDTGIYGGLYRFVDVLLVLPRVLVVVAFPSMSSLWIEDRNRFHQMLHSLQSVLTCVALPVLFLLMAWSGFLLNALLGPDFAAGGTALRLVAFGSFFAFHSFLLQQALQSSGHERSAAIALLVAVLTNVTLNAVLIPEHGFFGAAIATLATEVVYVTCLYFCCWSAGVIRGSRIQWSEWVGALLLTASLVATFVVPRLWSTLFLLVAWMPVVHKVRPDRILLRDRGG